MPLSDPPSAGRSASAGTTGAGRALAATITLCSEAPSKICAYLDHKEACKKYACMCFASVCSDVLNIGRDHCVSKSFNCSRESGRRGSPRTQIKSGGSYNVKATFANASQDVVHVWSLMQQMHPRVTSCKCDAHTHTHTPPSWAQADRNEG